MRARRRFEQLTAGVKQLILPKAGDVYQKLHGAIRPGTPLPDEIELRTGREPLWVNLGYWKGVEQVTLDNLDRAPELLMEAQREMARLLARAAKMGETDEVLDCGYGYGDQDVLWMEEYRPRRIVGLNITQGQIAVARRRVELLGLQDRIDLRRGSATAIDVPGSFDIVTALECAFHFATREDFLREAFRVLRPGGRLVAADMIMRDDPSPATLAMKLREQFLTRYLHLPPENNYGPTEYLRILARHGFRNARIESISNEVWRPYHKAITAIGYSERGASREKIAERLHYYDTTPIRMFRDHQEEYVLVYAEKPA